MSPVLVDDKPARLLDLGRRPFAEVWQMQRDIVAARQRDELEDTLVLVEHPEVITLGRGSHAENLVNPSGVPTFEIERGGDVTYHGPGQLVGYPIFKLREGEKDLHRYLRNIEQSLIEACQALAVPAGRKAGFTGAWTSTAEPRKLASIGVACKRWVTLHGFALNVSTDLSRFALINPCGLEASVMSSLSRELGREVGLEEVKPVVVDAVARVFARRFASR